MLQEAATACSLSSGAPYRHGGLASDFAPVHPVWRRRRPGPRDSRLIRAGGAWVGCAGGGSPAWLKAADIPRARSRPKAMFGRKVPARRRV